MSIAKTAALRAAAERRSERLGGMLVKIAAEKESSGPSWYKGSRPWSQVPDATRNALIKRHQEGSSSEHMGGTSKAEARQASAQRKADNNVQMQPATPKAQARQESAQRKAGEPDYEGGETYSGRLGKSEVSSRRATQAKAKQEGAQVRADRAEEAKKESGFIPAPSREDVIRAKQMAAQRRADSK